MDHNIQKLRKGEKLNFPPSQLNQGCLKETSRLQSNLGEQGSVTLLDDIHKNTVKIYQGNFYICTVRDPKVYHFFQQKMLEKWDTLGTFTQKIPFLDYNKTKTL